MIHPALQRVSDTRLSLSAADFPALVFATDRVPLERGAVDELLGVLTLARAAGRLSPAARIERVAITPDFHKGAGIPVGTVFQATGFVVPQAIGNDIGCGMRLHLSSLTREQVEPHLGALEARLRHLFFEGGRDLALTGRQREALLRGGVPGLREAVPPAQESGLWRLFHRQDAATDALGNGGVGLSVGELPPVQDWLGDPGRLSHDAQLGSVGGGNHFAELQTVRRILDPHAAHLWGLREGQVVVMVHSGSLGFGHLGGSLGRRLAREHFPAGLERPPLLPLLTEHRAALDTWLSAAHAAAHFASVNRLMLALMVQGALEGVAGETDFRLLYDAAHNLVWAQGEHFLHRKGATPAGGFADMEGGPFAYTGEPVLVPGSMGASSFVLAGRGLPEALNSASHGAGRQRARGEAMRGHEAEFEAFLRDFRVVTPVDDRRARADIRERKLAELRQEAPYAYKGIGPVVETLTAGGLAHAVAELSPLLTVKG